MTRVRHHHHHQQSRSRSNTNRADNDEGGDESTRSSSPSASSRSASHTSCTSSAAPSAATTTRSPPLAMASSARDRLQASARELFKNLEEAFMTPTSGTGSRHGDGPSDGQNSAAEEEQPLAVAPWEAALRTVFSACTTGAEQNAVPEPTERSGERASSSSLGRSSAGSKKPSSRRAVGTPTGTVPPPVTTTAQTPVVSTVPPPQHRQDMGEHIYAQLFFDDQLRAARAVQNTNGTFPPSGGATPQQLTLQSHKVSPSPLSSPFPVSSPQLRQHPPLMASPLPITATELNISQNLTFDDSISAISAHTLEAMAHNHNPPPPRATTAAPAPDLGQPRSGDSTLFPPASVMEDTASPHLVMQAPLPGAPSATLGASPSPFFASPESNSSGKPTPLSLYRSHSNNSRHSKNSHSTRTTESSSFDQWQQEDAKYWAREAQRDAAALERQPPPPSSSSSRKHPSKSSSQQHRRKDRIPPSSSTGTSACSSATNPRSPNRHPHDGAGVVLFADHHHDDVDVDPAGLGDEWIPSAARWNGGSHTAAAPTSRHSRGAARSSSSGYEMSEI